MQTLALDDLLCKTLRAMTTSFQQAPPTLDNQYESDRVLRSYLTRVLPAEILSEIQPALSEMGRLSGGEQYQL